MEDRSKYGINYNEYIVFGDPTGKLVLKLDLDTNIVTVDDDTLEELKKYHEIILKEKYFYTKADIATLFDFNNQFFQKFMRKDFSPIYITKNVRDALKEIRINDKEVVEMKKDLLEVIDPNNKIFYKEEDILNWIINNFHEEVTTGTGTEYKEVTLADAKHISENGLISNKNIKAHFDFKHDMQTTLFIKGALAAGVLKKYILYNEGKKRPIIRYLEI